MAGGHHPKPPSHKPSASSSSASHRKSRWESDNPTASNPPADPKPDNSKPPSSKPPNSKPSPSAAQPKPPSDPIRPPFPVPDSASTGPPPPPAYGFHMLDRRTIVLADGSVRSYFALPPDYQDFTPPPRPMDPAGRFFPMGPGGPGPELGLGFDKRFPGAPMSPDGFRDNRDDRFGPGRPQDYWNSLGLDKRGPADASMKRKFIDEEDRRDENDAFAKQRQKLLQYGNPNGFGDMVGTSSPFRRDEELRASKYMRIGGGGGGVVGLKHLEVDQSELKKAFLFFAKVINESASQRKSYWEDGRQGPLKCIACGRSSKDFPDMHALMMHTYNSENADLRVDHLGLHKALCVLMGWNYSTPPDNSKAYQFLPADEAAANQDDLIMWPPTVIIHNTITGKGKDGRMEGLGNKAMDIKIKELGCATGKSKSLYARDGHQGITLVKFTGDPSGLKEAVRLGEFFEKDNHGRKAWTRVQPLALGSKDDEKNLNLVKLDEKTGEKKRILYGYLGTAADLEKIDFDTRKKIVIESRREYKPSK